MERKRVFFPFLPFDYKAAGEWLNAQAQEGWALKKLRLRFALLERTDAPPKYTVAPLAGNVNTGIAFEQKNYWQYINAMRNAGWQYVENQSLLHVFSASQDTPPLEEAPADAAARMREFVRSRMFSALVLLVGFLLFFIILIPTTAFSPDMLSLNAMLFLYLLLAGGICALLVRLAYLIYLSAQLRQEEHVGAFPFTRSIEAAKLRGTLFLAGIAICILLFFAAFTADILIDTANLVTLYNVTLLVMSVASSAIASLFQKKKWRVIIGIITTLALVVSFMILVLHMEERQSTEVVAVNAETTPALVLHPVEKLTRGRLQVQRSPLVSYTVYEAFTEDGYSYSYYARSATKALADGIFEDMTEENVGLQETPPSTIPFAGVDRAVWWTNSGITETLVLQQGNATLRIWYRGIGMTYADPAFQQKILQVFLAGEYAQ